MITSTPVTPEARYAALVEAHLSNPAVNVGIAGKKGFGAAALCINQKIFAMLSRDRLVVKIPRQRVDALIAAGVGVRFDPGHGRLMKEWLSVEPTSEADWLSLAHEALAFVGAQP